MSLPNIILANAIGKMLQEGEERIEIVRGLVLSREFRLPLFRFRVEVYFPICRSLHTL